MVKKDKVSMDNIVRISCEKSIESYILPIFLRMLPNPYELYECIILQFTGNMKNEIFWLLNGCARMGLEVDRNYGNGGLFVVEDGIKVDKSKFLQNAYQIKLKKIGALQGMSEEEIIGRTKPVVQGIE